MSLTRRQLQTVELYTKGLVAKEIGAKLGISPRTVEHYRNQVMRVFKARTTAHMVALYLQHKYKLTPQEIVLEAIVMPRAAARQVYRALRH